MDSYKLQLFLHIAAAIVGLGATFAYPFLQGFAERQGVGATRFALRVTDRIENFLVTPAAVLLFLFGLGLIFDDTTGYSDDFPTWLAVSIVWFLAAFLVANTVQRMHTRRALEALDGVPDDAPLPEAYVPIGKRMQIVGGLLALSVIGIAFLMVWKPGE